MRYPYLLLLATTLSLPCSATEMVFVPINPSFGGNPLNGPNLMNTAQAQNSYEGKSGSGLQQKSSLQQFNENLQRAILNKIANAVTGNVVSSTGQLIPGTIETTDFIIVISDLGGGLLQVTTTDKVTGQSTSFQVSSAL